MWQELNGYLAGVKVMQAQFSFEACSYASEPFDLLGAAKLGDRGFIRASGRHNWRFDVGAELQKRRSDRLRGDGEPLVLVVVLLFGALVRHERNVLALQA